MKIKIDIITTRNYFYNYNFLEITFQNIRTDRMVALSINDTNSPSDKKEHFIKNTKRN